MLNQQRGELGLNGLSRKKDQKSESRANTQSSSGGISNISSVANQSNISDVNGRILAGITHSCQPTADIILTDD